VKIGITLPQFNADPHAMIAAAQRAEAAGIDGVFAYDHYPRPDRPEAQHGLTMLGALAVATEGVDVGLLVARVGVSPDRVLLSQFHTAARLAGPERFIAGVGVGDRQSDTEDVALGITRPPTEERFARLEFVAATLKSEFGLTVWVAGKSALAAQVAATLGVTRNLWDPTDAQLKEAVAAGPVTWGATGDIEPDKLRALADAGVTYAVVAPRKAGAPDAADRVMDAKARAGLT
jgi:alkanesulfonate monooxygenase SsuD/methylene tetrahydromethanopterin reductase-like flavin-dependent oxidoreductase (luciferase family)